MKAALPTILLLLPGLLPPLNAQVDTSHKYIAAIVYLDSFVVRASRHGFDVEDFIRLVREDDSFYEAFRNLRRHPFLFDTDFRVFDKKGRLDAMYLSTHRQLWDGRCRSMEVLKETIVGKFWKRKRKHRYYTFRMYDRLFFTHGKVCELTDAEWADDPASLKGMEKHVEELKRLVFRPGEQADVPLVGKKTAIFSEKLIDSYDFSITNKHYADSIDCFVFTATVKPEVEARHPGKTIIKYLETWFERHTFQVIARRYHLKAQNPLFEFDVRMDIQLAKLGSLYYPARLEYEGRWDIPASKPEHVRFRTRFYRFGQ